jgi:quercetin dioxygenase-like cupin family protein
MNPTPTLRLAAPGTGRIVEAFGDHAEFLVEGRHTDGHVTQFILTTPPGGGPPLHLHEREDEVFYVLEGRVAYLEAQTGVWTEGGPGTTACMPRGAPHTFQNVGTGRLRQLVTTTPSGFEDFFTEATEVFAAPGPLDLDKATAIAARHGIRLLPPPG